MAKIMTVVLIKIFFKLSHPKKLNRVDSKFGDKN